MNFLHYLGKQPMKFTNKTNQSKKQPQDTTLVEKIVHDEVAKLTEGNFTDMVKSAWEKTKGVATSAWEQVKNKFLGATQAATQTVNKKLSELKSSYPQIKSEFDELRAIESQSGEKIQNAPAIAQAMKLPGLVTAAKSELDAAKKSVYTVVQNDDGVKQAGTAPLQQAQEAYMGGVSQILEKTLFEMAVADRKKSRHLNEVAIPENLRTSATIREAQQLNEAGLVGILGISLGALGGIPLLLKGLHKLAKYFGLEKTAVALESAYHVMHHLEETVIDYLVPDKLSYMYYQSKHKIFAKETETAMPFEEYKTSDVRKKVEMRIYKIVLVYFLFHGVHGALEAGASLLGASEAAASTVKAIEIGTEIAELTGVIAGDHA